MMAEKERMAVAYDKELIAGKLRRWERYLLNFRLPTWNEIPNIGLYMEQVVDLLRGYLDYMPPELKEEEQPVTGAAINNYVRRKLLPGPRRKRYYRMHIACLIMICTLKQSLNMSRIQTLLPNSEDEDVVRAAYESYAARHNAAARYFVEQVKLASARILNHEEKTELAVETTEELICSAAVVSGFSRLLAEKLLFLDNRTAADGGKIEEET